MIRRLQMMAVLIASTLGCVMDDTDVDLADVNEAEAPAVQLLDDPRMQRGFQTPVYCDTHPQAHSGDAAEGVYLARGTCLDLEPGTPSRFRTLPFTSQLGPDGNAIWSLNEGVHYVGNSNTLLHDHYLANNQTPAGVRSGGDFVIQQCRPGVACSNPANLIKSIRVKNGRFGAYWNTANEIDNVASDFSSAFARRTWPHLLIEQSFEELVDLAEYEEITLSFDGRINSISRLAGGPAPTPSAHLMAYAVVREKRARTVAGFVGVRLYSQPTVGHDVLSKDQFGQFFFSRATRMEQFGGKWSGTPRAASIPVKALLAEAIARAAADTSIPNLLPSPDDYYLAGFNIGWEALGHWTMDFDVGNVSMMGRPRVTTSRPAWTPEIAGYLLANPDLRQYFARHPAPASFGDQAAAHFRSWGFGEGRRTCMFNEAHYIAANPGLASAPAIASGALSATGHYQKWGAAEGRTACCFSSQTYLSRNGDVKRAIQNGSFRGNAYEHYQQFGVYEGRPGACCNPAQAGGCPP